MKGWLKLLVLGAIPILAVTMVANQGLAADKGAQLIFQSNMAHHNFISVVNTDATQAVTVLVQYYNNDMEMAVWYLRVIPGATTVLVDPFNHMIPGSDPATNIGDAIMASGKAGNGHFVIAVTPVGAVTVDLPDTPGVNEGPVAGGRVNILFPDFLAKDMDGTDNIDACGTFVSVAADDSAADRDSYTHQKDDDDTEDNRCKDDDDSSKNVGPLNVGNAQPIVFNHLTGHFTEALVGTDAGGADQTASWGGTPVIRPAVQDTNNAMANLRDYQILDGTNAETANEAGGRLAEKDAGGMEIDVHDPDADGPGHTVLEGSDTVDGFTTIGDNKILAGYRNIRGIGGTMAGALVLPALHGGGAETKQIVLLLSVADSFGDPGAYKLIPAMTGYMVIPMDQAGNPLDMKAGADDPVFGSGGESEDADVPSAAIIVNGINVMTDADLSKCSGTAIDGPWTLDHLTGLVPEASAGGKDFAGLDAMLDPMMNASPGWVKFARSNLTCKKDYGDGDAHNLTAIEPADGVPVKDERTYMGGTLIVEEMSTNRTFVTTGRALLKFITADSTFAASWTLKSPVNTATDDGDVSN
jgi:hypothetical protein